MSSSRPSKNNSDEHSFASLCLDLQEQRCQEDILCSSAPDPENQTLSKMLKSWATGRKRLNFPVKAPLAIEKNRLL